MTNRPADSEAIKKRVLEKAGEYFPDLARTGLDADCTPFSEKSTYPLYRVRLVDRNTKAPVAGVIVKFAPVHPLHNEGLTEYGHLALMTKWLEGSGDLRVPRPLDFYRDVNALATEEVGGKRFAAELMRDASAFVSPDTARRLHRVIARSGRWLSSFHRATARGEAHPFGDEFSDGLRRKLRTLRPFGFPRETAELAERTVERLAERTGARTVPFAARHGDFGPQNFHIGDEWLCVFDLSYNTSAAVYDDITYFLVTLETLNPLPRYPFFSRRKALALRGPFLEGYFGTDRLDRDTRVFLEGYYLKALVYRAVKQRRNVSRRPMPVRLLFDRTKIAGFYPRRIARQCALVSELLAV